MTKIFDCLCDIVSPIINIYNFFFFFLVTRSLEDFSDSAVPTSDVQLHWANVLHKIW